MNQATPASTARVLVADDDDAFRTLLAERLRRAGYAVTELHDGRELFDVLTAARPGFFRAVVSDHRMPGLFGLECLALAGSRAPFVIVSGTDDPAFHASAERFGAAAVIPKSTDLEEIVKLVLKLAPHSRSTGGFRPIRVEPPRPS
jgi:DNA-binding NtrC family response regulator